MKLQHFDPPTSGLQDSTPDTPGTTPGPTEEAITLRAKRSGGFSLSLLYVHFIHSLDSVKLANELSKRQKQQGKNLGYFIQLNLGSEDQKGGLEINDLKSFYDHCVNDLNLLILGLMAIPPNDQKPEKHFKKISELNQQYNFHNLSLGMSNDYLSAIKYGATHVRIGSSIFGARS